jgi:hypothetical protein
VTIVGGLRLRLLRDSLHHLIDDALDERGWYDPDRQHRPVNFLAHPLPWNVPVEPNVISLEIQGTTVAEAETGSFLSTDTITAFVDIYAENDSFGVDISNDIRDILRGRLGQNEGGTVPLYDYRNATPPVIGHIAITDIRALRNSAMAQELWQRHWFRVRCEIQDSYYTSQA